MDIAAWLRGLGLERYEIAFRENEIDWAVLPKLTADDLKDIGVTAVGHRRNVSTVISRSKTEASSSRRSANTTRSRSTHQEPEVGTFATRLASTALLRSSPATLWRSPGSVIPQMLEVRSAPSARAAQRHPRFGDRQSPPYTLLMLPSQSPFPELGKECRRSQMASVGVGRSRKSQTPSLSPAP